MGLRRVGDACIINSPLALSVQRERKSLSESYIFAAVRTPRGRGKKDGALHTVTPDNLISGLLKSLQQRHNLDTSQLDDVVLGCVEPVMEQGADIARTAVLMAGYNQACAGVVVSRFCASEI